MCIRDSKSTWCHDKTPSAFVAYLAVIAGVILIGMIVTTVIKRLAQRKDREISSSKNQELLWMGFAISAWLSMGFIMALLRWQPWGTRLMYPALAVTVIMSANMLYCLMRHWKKAITAAVLGILIVLSTMLAIPSVTYNLQPAVEFVKGGCQNRLNPVSYTHLTLPTKA